MSRGPVVFQCDAGPVHGIGHVMRCLALAEEFAGRGHEVVMIADLDAVPWAGAQVRRRGFRTEQPTAEVTAFDPALIVIDSYELPEQHYRAVRASGVPTLALVDGDPAGRPADLWLDQNIGAEDDLWPVPAGTTRLAGLRYALIRDDLRGHRPATPVRTETVPPRVFAFFGGTDAYGAAPVVLAALVGTGVPAEVTVVAATPALDAACRAVVPAPGQRVEVVAPTDELAARVVAADVVLSAAGTSSWELLCLGAATGLVCVADNQHTSYGRAVEAGLVSGLGYLEALRTAGPNTAERAMVALLGSAEHRARLRERAWHAVDGRGRERVADACAALMS